MAAGSSGDEFGALGKLPFWNCKRADKNEGGIIYRAILSGGSVCTKVADPIKPHMDGYKFHAARLKEDPQWVRKLARNTDVSRKAYSTPLELFCRLLCDMARCVYRISVRSMRQVIGRYR